MPTKKNFNFRGAISLLTTWAFLILLVTGIVLFIVPQGRIAYWTDWQLINLGKEGWSEIHTLFGILFIIIGIWHLVYNWKPFLNYLRKKAKESTRPSKELGVTFGLTIILIFLSLTNLPPASWLFDLNDTIKSSWVDSPEVEPPFGHAEELSLQGFTKKMNIDTKEAKTALEEAGWKFSGETQSLKELARQNGSSSMVLHGLIRHLEPAPEEINVPISEWSAADIEARFSGTGIGRKSVAEISKMLGVPIDQAIARLQAAKAKTTEKEQLKQLADRVEQTPMMLLNVIANIH
jgi:hypothetical protein